MQSVDGIAGLRADLIGQTERADDRSCFDHVQDDGALAAPPIGSGDFGGTVLLEQFGTTHLDRGSVDLGSDTDRRRRGEVRSEEHTSELQSRFDLVCRLLLEKKNMNSVERF